MPNQTKATQSKTSKFAQESLNWQVCSSYTKTTAVDTITPPKHMHKYSVACGNDSIAKHSSWPVYHHVMCV